MSAWITMIPPEQATGLLKQMYEQAATPAGTVDNVMQAHSLRPHTMGGHLALYRSVLHHPDNTLPLSFLEIVAAYTSIINRCNYSLTHHFANARQLLQDNLRSDRILQALHNQRPDDVFEGKELALLEYAAKLTANVSEMKKSDMDSLHEAGCRDGEILEVNQVCAYFNYSNRLLNGLGVTTGGDVIGYYQEEE